MKSKDKIWRKFEEARRFVHSLGLKDTIEWYQYAKSGKRPSDIPSNANKAYKDRGWIDWPDFLGTRNNATYKKKFRSFEAAKVFVHTLGLKNIRDYREYAKSGNRPAKIPSDPQLQYKDRGWIDWPDFLGTQKKEGRDKTGHFTTKIWLPFEQAREKDSFKRPKKFHRV